MPISTRTRFEIFKRDNFKCLYCGATPIDKPLHVDHVKPVAEGGADDPANLVTSCRDCNLGKGPVPLEKKRHRASFASDEEKEHAEQIREYLKVQREILDAKKEAEAMVLERWEDLIGEWHYTLPRYVVGAVREFGVDGAMEAVEAVARKNIPDGIDRVRYFCGVLRRLREPAGAVKGKVEPGAPGADEEMVPRSHVRAHLLNALGIHMHWYWSYRLGQTPMRDESMVERYGWFYRKIKALWWTGLNQADLFRLIDAATPAGSDPVEARATFTRSVEAALNRERE